MVEPAAGDLDNPPKKFRGESSRPPPSPGRRHSLGPAGGPGRAPAALVWSVEPPSAEGCLLIRVPLSSLLWGHALLLRGAPTSGRGGACPPLTSLPPPRKALHDWVFPEDLLALLYAAWCGDWSPRCLSPSSQPRS